MLSKNWLSALSVTSIFCLILASSLSYTACTPLEDVCGNVDTLNMDSMNKILVTFQRQSTGEFFSATDIGITEIENLETRIKSTSFMGFFGTDGKGIFLPLNLGTQVTTYVFRRGGPVDTIRISGYDAKAKVSFDNCSYFVETNRIEPSGIKTSFKNYYPTSFNDALNITNYTLQF